MVNADRDKSEQPALAVSTTPDATTDTPEAATQAQGGDERVRRYRAALYDPASVSERRRVDGAYVGSDRTAWETLSEWQARAVMAVADAEHAELRAEVERLHEIVTAAALETYTPDGSERFIAAFHEQARDRKAAERALAEERAEVARLRFRIREYADSRGVYAGDEDDDWHAGYRQAQRESLWDAQAFANLTLAGPESETSD